MSITTTPIPGEMSSTGISRRKFTNSGLASMEKFKLSESLDNLRSLAEKAETALKTCDAPAANTAVSDVSDALSSLNEQLKKLSQEHPELRFDGYSAAFRELSLLLNTQFDMEATDSSLTALIANKLKELSDGEIYDLITKDGSLQKQIAAVDPKDTNSPNSLPALTSRFNAQKQAWDVGVNFLQALVGSGNNKVSDEAKGTLSLIQIMESIMSVITNVASDLR